MHYEALAFDLSANVTYFVLGTVYDEATHDLARRQHPYATILKTRLLSDINIINVLSL